MLTSLLVINCTGERIETVPPPPPQSLDELEVSLYLSTKNGVAKFTKQEETFYLASDNNLPTIEINTTETYQTMDGFGFSLTGGVAYHLNNMSPGKRLELLNELFANDNNNIGVSYLRISIVGHQI